MRGTLLVEDWIKLAAGVLLGLFVLYIAWIFAMGMVSTECWRNTAKPFDEALLGTKSLQTPLGNKDIFSIPLVINKDCFQEIFFAHGALQCGSYCEKGINTHWWTTDDKLSSSAVNDCKNDCGSKCTEKDCIIIIPIPKFYSSFFTINKPKVYGSGDYKFQYSNAISNGVSIDADNKNSYACLLFTKQSDGKTYLIEPKSGGDCK